LLGSETTGRRDNRTVTCTQTKAPRKKNGKGGGWGGKKKQRSQKRKTGVPNAQESKNQRIEDAISQSKERNSVGALGLQLRALGRRG